MFIPPRMVIIGFDASSYQKWLPKNLVVVTFWSIQFCIKNAMESTDLWVICLVGIYIQVTVVQWVICFLIDEYNIYIYIYIYVLCIIIIYIYIMYIYIYILCIYIYLFIYLFNPITIYIHNIIYTNQQKKQKNCCFAVWKWDLPASGSQHDAAQGRMLGPRH